jgi:hypothetical protein
MGQIEIYPFCAIGDTGQRYPDWLRGLDGHNGVYLIREHDSTEIAYVGESHSDRLYGTLTRHFQRWSPKHDTAGPTYARATVEIAVILVPKTHAPRLQNELICELAPRDNRLVCAADQDAQDEDADEADGQDADDDDPGQRAPPRGYDYDIDDIIDALFYVPSASEDTDADIPF